MIGPVTSTRHDNSAVMEDTIANSERGVVIGDVGSHKNLSALLLFEVAARNRRWPEQRNLVDGRGSLGISIIATSDKYSTVMQHACLKARASLRHVRKLPLLVHIPRFSRPSMLTDFANQLVTCRLWFDLPFAGMLSCDGLPAATPCPTDSVRRKSLLRL